MGEQEELKPGQKFDRKMQGYMHELQQKSLSRRTLIRTAAGATGMAAASVAGGLPLVPGLSVLAQDATTFVFGLEGDVRGLEPALAYDFTANPVVCNISEGLMKLLPDGSMEPLLAESYEHPDPLTYIYKLRSGLKFHNGDPVTLDDVMASIDRVKDPVVAGPMAWMYDPVASVEAVDDMTLKVTLTSPSALYQFVAATTAGHVISKRAIEEFGADLLRNPVGTGPFKFVKWDAGSEIELEKNPEYWQTGKPAFDKIVFKIVAEGTTRVTGLKNGDLNTFTQVPPDQVAAVQGFEDVTWQEVVGYTINNTTMRTDQPPFDDVKVRKAVAMAIPYDDIMTAIVGDTGVLAFSSAVPPSMPGSAGDQIPAGTFDLEGAKALLAESSLPDGFSTTYSLIAPNDVWVPMAVAVQEALKELNIEVEINQLAYADMITLQQAGDYEGMMNFQWGSDFPDASGNLLPLFHTRNFPPQNNHSYYSNPDVDKMLDDSEAELDVEKRTQMLVDIQKLIAEDQPTIFFEHFKWFMPISSSWTGYAPSPLWYWDSIGRDLTPVVS